MKKILITGVSGFLGTHLCHKLKKSGLEVVGTIFSEQNAQIFLKNNPDVKTYLVDLTSPGYILEKIFIENDIEFVVHCAAMKHVNISQNNPTRCVKTNIIGSLKLVELCQKYQVENMIAISTDKSNNPSCTYGMSKNLMEKIVLENGYGIYKGVNFFGSTGSVINIWKLQAANNKKLTANADNTVRYFIPIEQVCDEIYQNLYSKEEINPKQAYKISLHDLLDCFCKINKYKKISFFESGNFEKNEEEINKKIRISIPSMEEIISIFGNDLKIVHFNP